MVAPTLPYRVSPPARYREFVLATGESLWVPVEMVAEAIPRMPGELAMPVIVLRSRQPSTTTEDHMAAPTRPYSIRNRQSGDIVAIIRATSPAAALRHHCRDLFAVGVASVDDAFEAQDNGVRPVDATADDDAPAEG